MNKGKFINATIVTAPHKNIFFIFQIQGGYRVRMPPDSVAVSYLENKNLFSYANYCRDIQRKLIKHRRMRIYFYFPDTRRLPSSEASGLVCELLLRSPKKANFYLRFDIAKDDLERKKILVCFAFYTKDRVLTS